MILVTSPFYGYHEVTLTLTSDLLQGQICYPAGGHNSSNLLVYITILPLEFTQNTVITNTICITDLTWLLKELIFYRSFISY